MKKFFLHIICLYFILINWGCKSQIEKPKIINNDYIKSEDRLCANKEKIYIPEYSFDRFLSTVNTYEQNELSIKDSIKNKIIFYGSSTIAYWGPFLKDEFKPLPVIGHGFGGATFPELIFYAPRLLYPLTPKIIVIYCENDQFILPDKSVLQVNDDICELFTRIHSNLPNTKIYYLAMKHSLGRDYKWEEMNDVNINVKSLCESSPDYLTYIDLNYLLKDVNGNIDSTLFEKDLVHLNNKAYDKWSNILMPLLEKDFK